MSVEREGSLTRFTCDGGGTCRANYEGVDGFSSAWKEARAHGWVNAETSDRTWQHFCPTCKRDLGDD
jgi:hypothetical protein